LQSILVNKLFSLLLTHLFCWVQWVRPLNTVHSCDWFRSYERAVHAEHFLIRSCLSHDRSQWHALEHGIHSSENTPFGFDIVAQTLSTLLPKSVRLVHRCVLLGTSEKHDLCRILQLESHQQTNHFEGEGTMTDVVAKKNVVKRVDVSLLTRLLPDVEKAHQVGVVPVEPAENLERRLEALNQDRLCHEDILTSLGQLNYLRWSQAKALRRLHLLAFFGLKESPSAQLDQRVVLNGLLTFHVAIPGHWRIASLSGIQLVNGHLADQVGELFSGGCVLPGLVGEANVSLVRQFEFLLILELHCTRRRFNLLFLCLFLFDADYFFK
jgi:hypothetical protein